MGKWKRVVLIWSVSLVLLAVCGMAGAAEKGGVLRVAVIDEPPTLDQQVVTSDLATMIAQHIFEGLYTFDSKYSPVPLLVKSEEIKDNGKNDRPDAQGRREIPQREDARSGRRACVAEPLGQVRSTRPSSVR